VHHVFHGGGLHVEQIFGEAGEIARRVAEEALERAVDAGEARNLFTRRGRMENGDRIGQRFDTRRKRGQPLSTIMLWSICPLTFWDSPILSAQSGSTSWVTTGEAQWHGRRPRTRQIGC